MKKTGVFFQAQNESPHQKGKRGDGKEENIKTESLQS